MKAILKRFFVGVFIVAMSLIAFWVMRANFFSPHQALNKLTKPKPFDPRLSILALGLQKQKAPSVSLQQTTSEQHHGPAPLDSASEAEQHFFPGAIVVEATEIAGPESDQKIRIRILKTNFKYPFIRTEELIDQQGVISRVEMVANHFLVTLPPGIAPEAFLKKMGLQASFITRLMPDASVYRVDLISQSLSALPRGLEKGSEIPEAVCEPDLINHVQ